ncbi:MAG TPA: Sir2 family NAD-dependent protein deacetylase [Kofleriaceae bacterium]
MELGKYRNIVLLTGAGISQAAGLPTYRGKGGLWSDPELAALVYVEALATRRRESCSMLWDFRCSIAKVEPTAAHRALAAFEDRLPAGTSFLIITQNVDGLHQRAGSRRVVEYHGTLQRWRCEQCGVELEPPDGDLPVHCDELMRPSAVLFGELIPPAAERAAKLALRGCDLFVAIGTSGTVWPAANFVRWAELNGARRVLLNLEIDQDAHEAYPECHAGTADELVPQLFGPA